MNLKMSLSLNKKKFIYFFFYFTLLIYAIIVAFNLSITSDAGFYINLGKERIKYILSLGQLKNNLSINQEAFPAIYLSIVGFFAEFFPKNFDIQIFYIVNFVSSCLGAIGVYKLSKILFNKNIALINFLFFLFFPSFFGHMLINGRDTTILISNIWITYFSIKYLEFNIIKNKKYIIYLSFFLAIGLGVRFHFIATLIPLFLYIIYKLSFVSKEKKLLFLKDLFLILIISISLILLFWEPLHTNFFSNLLQLFKFNKDNLWGWPYNIINGDIYQSNAYPILFLFKFFFFKSPEFIIFLYLISIFFIFYFYKKIKKKINNFNEKIFLVLLNIFFPLFLTILFEVKIYDGIRLFLFMIPYFTIIPSLIFYLLIDNFKNIFSRIGLFISLVLILYFFYFFIKITPYHYIYVNRIAGNFSTLSNKFEIDYWGISLNELIKKFNYSNENEIKISVCGVLPASVKYNLNRLKKNLHYKIVGTNEKPDFYIMVNRIIKNQSSDILTNCFKEFQGNDVFAVKRLGLDISLIRESAK